MPWFGRRGHRVEFGDRGLVGCSWVVDDGSSEVGAVSGEGAFDRLAEIAPRVPAVGNLDCLRRSGVGIFCVGAGTVTSCVGCGPPIPANSTIACRSATCTPMPINHRGWRHVL